MEIKYEIENPGEYEAGIPGFTDTVTIKVSSGDPGGEAGEFADFMRQALSEWYDGAIVSQSLAEKEAAAPDLMEALEDIARGAGPYSRDPLVHASNTIEYMVNVAQAAIAKARGEG